MRFLNSPKSFVWVLLVVAGLAFLPGFSQAAKAPAEPEKNYGAAEARKAASQPERWITADHGDFEKLQQEFDSGPEVTKACLSCHNEAGKQMRETIHWTWICPADPSEQMGKAGVTLNNFCINIKDNEARCTSCHAGYGWKDDSFDLSKEENIDCLVCHEQTGTYKKFPAGAGHPVSEPKDFGGKTFQPPDWQKVAQSVSRPSRENCGVCHFYGGGGDGVKHGDLDSSLFDPPKKLDVHMSEDGAGFDCTRCHTTRAHSIAGRCYKQPAFTERKSMIDDDMIERISCTSCHTETPHEPGSKLDDHTDKVACQSCHIPTFARQNPTKMRWDWSKAGRLTDDGKPVVEKGDHGKAAYHGKKGAFRWEKDVVPEYHWFNGSLEYILLTDQIEADEPVEVNRVMGSPDDSKSRIYPFKVHAGTLPFDTQNRTLLSPNLFGKEKEAYWKSYDWDMALETGMEAHGLDFSGEFEFIETEYYFPITHMVAPAEDALECRACHADQTRMAGLTGFYMPGRDQSSVLDTLGWLIVLGSLAGVVIHGIMRKVLAGKKG